MARISNTLYVWFVLVLLHLNGFVSDCIRLHIKYILSLHLTPFCPLLRAFGHGFPPKFRMAASYAFLTKLAFDIVA